METMGERIQRLMKECGYSQTNLASLVGVTGAAMSRYINNDRMPKAEVVANLATALNTTSDYLINGKTPEEDFDELYRLVARSASSMTTEQKMYLIKKLMQ